MTNGMSDADISSLLYVKSNTFKIGKKKKKKDSPPATLCTSNKGKHSKIKMAANCLPHLL